MQCHGYYQVTSNSGHVLHAPAFREVPAIEAQVKQASPAHRLISPWKPTPVADGWPNPCRERRNVGSGSRLLRIHRNAGCTFNIIRGVISSQNQLIRGTRQNVKAKVRISSGVPQNTIRSWPELSGSRYMRQVSSSDRAWAD
jgi:hypothetical protein